MGEEAERPATTTASIGAPARREPDGPSLAGDGHAVQQQTREQAGEKRSTGHATGVYTRFGG